MILIKDQENHSYLLSGLSADELIYLYNVCINYKAYLEQIIRMKDSQLLSFAPGKSADEVRANLMGQYRTCENFIAMWDENINRKDPDKPQA